MTQRTCGECQLCCELLPVKDIGKLANTKCEHQCRAGCAIYEKRPISCMAFSCKWLAGEDCGPRPDRIGMVLDPMPDFVRIVPDDGSPEQQQPVWQIWIDPKRPDAHRNEGFRKWLDAERMPALIRSGSHEGFLLVPPSMTGDTWFEKHTELSPDPEHTPEQIVEMLRRQGFAIKIE